MGGWKLEVFKLFTYVSFPVCLFYVFNQPQYFEEYVVNTRKKIFETVDPEKKEEFKKKIKEIRQMREQKELLRKIKEAE